MEICPKCESDNIKLIKAQGGIEQEICMKCGFTINTDKERSD